MAKLNWLKEGDLNSKLFHRVINFRKKGNTINGLYIEGRWSEAVQEVKREVYQHFSSHFKSERFCRPKIPQALMHRKLDDCDNTFLTAEFSESEVKAAIWDCETTKSPGPDGFSHDFFKNNWDMLSKEIMNMTAEFHRHGKLVKGINPSFIVLLPKKHAAQLLEEFRPISLIWSLYKIIVKILAKRLSKVLETLISDCQSAFIGGRQIMDGILIAHEAIDEAKKKKKQRALFKVDFAKAYDLVEWEYLDSMMEGMNFSPIWRAWMMECVSTASASVRRANSNSRGDYVMEILYPPFYS